MHLKGWFLYLFMFDDKMVWIKQLNLFDEHVEAIFPKHMVGETPFSNGWIDG